MVSFTAQRCRNRNSFWKAGKPLNWNEPAIAMEKCMMILDPDFTAIQYLARAVLSGAFPRLQHRLTG
jgi:hypothetical protein